MLGSLRTVGLAAIIAVLAVGCDNPTPNMGVVLMRSGDLRLLYKPCRPDALVYSVTISVDSNVVWRVTSSGSEVREFVLGETPLGFVEEVSLRDSLQGAYLTVTVSSSELRSDTEYVTWGDLIVDLVLVPRRGVETVEEFEKRNTCESRGLFGRCS